MVKIQQVLKYRRPFGVEFGPIDIVKYAEAFGTTGLRIHSADEIGPVLRQALNTRGPVLVEILQAGNVQRSHEVRREETDQRARHVLILKQRLFPGHFDQRPVVFLFGDGPGLDRRGLLSRRGETDGRSSQESGARQRVVPANREVIPDYSTQRTQSTQRIR